MTRLTTRTALLAGVLALVAAACSGAANQGETATTSPAGTSATSAPVGRTVDNPVPTTQFALFSGETASLISYAGAPLVVNFWASWCPSCVAEMSAAFRPVREEVGEEVAFLGMNIQDRRELAEELLEETGVKWISAEDPNGELYVELGGLGMPFTIFVSPDGGIVDTHNGPLSKSQLRDKISELFGV